MSVQLFCCFSYCSGTVIIISCDPCCCDTQCGQTLSTSSAHGSPIMSKSETRWFSVSWTIHIQHTKNGCRGWCVTEEEPKHERHTERIHALVFLTPETIKSCAGDVRADRSQQKYKQQDYFGICMAATIKKMIIKAQEDSHSSSSDEYLKIWKRSFLTDSFRTDGLYQTDLSHSLSASLYPPPHLSLSLLSMHIPRQQTRQLCDKM